MEFTVKYGSWNITKAEQNKVHALEAAGFSPLTARVLAGRGFEDPAEAKAFLSACDGLQDPFLMKDMDKAVARIRQALGAREHIAVFGDYDVDGITATCLLTEFLRSQGSRVTHYIPGRIEEGYGLNADAISRLQEQGVSLIISVDCGITANEEALFCKQIGMDLIITDHHECKDDLPEAVAVVDPHRKDDNYPHSNLAGVGVAFKLAAAVLGDQEAILDRFSDLLCLGTVADVMPLVGENRAFVVRGLKALNETPRPGIAALAGECGCDDKAMTAISIGYTLAPRINAAGRMGRVELATELMLTQEPHRASVLAKQLCSLNRQRQDVEAEIYRDAEKMLQAQPQQRAIVLAGEDWHQGVVGIVASRLAEEYRCPAFLICLDGERGKASSRSFGGFNLFDSLEQLSHLLESYGGHELAAGFTIGRGNIDCFREGVQKLAGEFVASGKQKAALEIDCSVEPWLLNAHNILALEELEPCGAGCPKPVFCMENMMVEQMSEVGGGKHLRLRLSSGSMNFNAIFFSANILRSGISVGDRAEVAFTPQINEFKGSRSVQLNLVDIRPDRRSRKIMETDDRLLHTYASRQPLTAAERDGLLPLRHDFAALWRYLAANESAEVIHEELGCLSRKVSRYAGFDMRPGKVWMCLQVFKERGLLHCQDDREDLAIRLCPGEKKVDLEQSPVLIRLKQQKAGE